MGRLVLEGGVRSHVCLLDDNSYTEKVPPSNFYSLYAYSEYLFKCYVGKQEPEQRYMFWDAINLGDRVVSALKDLTVAMKQLNRSEEAIEVINSFRRLCSHQSQVSRQHYA